MGKQHTTRDQPRASSPINDNYCADNTRRTLTQGHCINSHVNFHVVTAVPAAPGHSQKRELSPGSPVCRVQTDYKLKYVKGVSCVTQLSCVKPVTNVRNVASNLPVGARLQNFWQTWLDLGAGPKVVQILKEGYTLPFRIRPNLTRSPTVISCYGNPHRNLSLLEALHQLIAKNAVELVVNQKSVGVFNRLFLVETHPRPEQTKSFPQGAKIQNGDTRNHQNFSPTGRMDHLHRFQGCLLPYTNTGTVQEISKISCGGSDILVQGSALWSVHSTLGVHCDSKGGETDGHSQGYKDPPIPRRLVGEGFIPPNLSPAHSGSSRNMPKTRLAGERREIGAGAQTSLQFCRLPVRSKSRSGQTDTGPLAGPTGQDTSNTFPAFLSGPAVHVSDRVINSHREASSPWLTAYETHTVAPQKQLEGTRITGEGDSNPQLPAPTFTMVARRRQCPNRPTITLNITCSASLYRRIKRRVGRSLK